MRAALSALLLPLAACSLISGLDDLSLDSGANGGSGGHGGGTGGAATTSGEGADGTGGSGSGGGSGGSGDCVVDLPGTTWAIVANQDGKTYWTHESGMDSGVLTLSMSEFYLVEGTGSTSNSPFGLHVIDTEVYWSAAMNGIWMATLDGAAEPGTPYGPADAIAFAISSDDSFVYWTDPQYNAVRKARRKTGADLASIATAGVANPRGLVVTGGFAYWVNQGTGSVMKVDPSDMTNFPITIAAVAGSPTGIDVKDGYVYWTIENGAPPEGKGAVMRAVDEESSTVITPIAIDQNNPKGIAVDADEGMVYWVNSGDDGMSNGSVMMAAITAENSQGTPLAEGQAQPMALAVTSTAIYWVNSGDGTVKRIPKPQ